jgi:hypothetical protein
MGGACSRDGIDDTIFWLESQMGRDHSEDLGVVGKIILEGILGK